MSSFGFIDYIIKINEHINELKDKFDSGGKFSLQLHDIFR